MNNQHVAKKGGTALSRYVGINDDCHLSFVICNLSFVICNLSFVMP